MEVPVMSAPVFSRLWPCGLLLILFSGWQHSVSAQQTFYYGRGGTKIAMESSPDRISLQLNNSPSMPETANLLARLVPLEELRPVSAAPGFFTVRLQAGTIAADVQRYVQALRDWPEVAFANPVYLIEGVEAIPFDHFVVRFQPSVSIAQIEALNRQHHVEVVRISKGNPHRYTLRLTALSDRSVVEMAQHYFESLPCVYALPDFVMPIALHTAPPTDTYYAYQYYFNQTNDIDVDAPEAWNLTKGSSSIVVAVIDEGVASHEDLPSSRLVAGHDAFGLTGGAPGGNESHGMASAGLIAASHNTVGVAGMAPNVKIMPVRIFDDYGNSTSNDKVADAIEFAWTNGAHILSNSWSSGSCDSDWAPPVRDAIEEAMSQGRGGLGSVVVFSAGNTAIRSMGNYGCVAFPANVPGVLSVGAATRSGSIQNYSPRDSDLDVVAPSGGLGSSTVVGCSGANHTRLTLGGDVWSLDIAGSPGYNPGNYGICPPTNYVEYVWTPRVGEPTPNNNYTAHFGGTSAACPQVSGIAALMLSSAVETLTDEAVVSIIQTTADDMGSSGYDQDFGYGRANAYDALYELRITGADVDGPTCLEPNENGTFTAGYWDGVKTLHYQWWYYSPCGALPDGKPVPNGPPCGAWTTYGGDLASIIVGNDTDFQLKVVITDATGTSVTSGIKYVTIDPYNGCSYAPAPKRSTLASAKPVAVLGANYPNPFNPTTEFTFTVDQPQVVTVEVLDVLGRRVALLHEGFVWAGEVHHVRFTAGPEPSGVYFYRVRGETFDAVRRMTLLK
jgi:hypothetical protein